MRWLTLIALSVACGAIAAFVFRRLASPGIGQHLDRMQAHLMEFRLFLDEPGLIFQAQRDLMRENGRLLRKLALPLAITVPLFAVVVWQADAYLGRGPLAANEPVVITAHVKAGDLSEVRLETPAEVAVETPGIRVPGVREVSWRIRPAQPFSGRLTVNGDVDRVDIPWPRKSWLGWFFAISAISALIAPRFMKRYALILLLVCPAWAAEKPPVILISIDTLRADHLSAYGNITPRTPNIDAYADRGTVFTAIDAAVPLTLPSHVSLMTSMYPFETRAEVNGDVTPPGAITLASILRAKGYRTAAFIGSMVLDRRYGLDRGFDVYDSPFQTTRVRRDAALVTRAALQFLEKNAGQPVFAFLHLYDLHTPYTLPQAAGLTPTRAGYDAELQYIDRTLGRFHEALARDGLWDKALIVVLADHGESLGDHGETSHGYFAYESTLHVPLIFRWPADAPKRPERIDGAGSVMDVAPTILDFLHIAAPSSFEGSNLLSSHERREPVYAESIYPRQAFGWAPLRTLRLGQYKYIDAPKPELYDLARDPGERTNVVTLHPAEAKTMKARIADLMARHAPKESGPGPAASARTREILGSLGYTAGGRQNAGKAAIDPKDKIAEAEAYESGLALLYSARYGAAIQAFQRIVSEDSRNLPALCALGEAYLRAGNDTRALGLWQQALEKEPNYQPAADSIGEYWLARKDYEKACRFIPAAAECAAKH